MEKDIPYVKLGTTIMNKKYVKSINCDDERCVVVIQDGLIKWFNKSSTEYQEIRKYHDMNINKFRKYIENEQVS